MMCRRRQRAWYQTRRRWKTRFRVLEIDLLAFRGPIPETILHLRASITRTGTRRDIAFSSSKSQELARVSLSECCLM
jgi:hypothetical protein